MNLQPVKKAMQTLHTLYKQKVSRYLWVGYILLGVGVITAFVSEIWKKNSQITRQNQQLHIYSQDLTRYRNQARVDSLWTVYYEQTIDGLHVQITELKTKQQAYEKLLARKPTDPVRILPLSDAERILTERYFPTEQKSTTSRQ